MRIHVVGSAAVLFLFGCSGETAPRVIAPSSTPATRAAAIVIVSGDHQQAAAGEPLQQPLVVRVTDARGTGIESAVVTFEISGTGGLNGKEAPGLSRVSSQTDSVGQAQVRLEPYDLGRISVSARVEGTTLAPVMFTADATVIVVEFRSPEAVGPYAAFWGPCRCSRTMNELTVPVGTPIEWATLDATPFTITSTSTPAGGASFDSGTLTRNSRFRFIPGVAGTWAYEDRFSGLRATLRAN
jgi:hypothetical protein